MHACYAMIAGLFYLTIGLFYWTIGLFYLIVPTLCACVHARMHTTSICAKQLEALTEMHRHTVNSYFNLSLSAYTVIKMRI